ncbi:glycosyltransferase family 2 protein [Hymenobacter sp. YC55]|uniref:glycosyltransferase n=1 Tax=Hymenobacter sp. YC55 TaxID=3034019 RepID=UPI0023F8636E|nr:glycosyltransferase family 2 protein [Hymenobacter sp. YC55]MDF7809752.1 glycosyltransferase family 2 protein [Hymenobacter sp. YC55]
MAFLVQPRATSGQRSSVDQQKVLWPTTPPNPRLRVSVIIPAKDEADNLPATLAALAAQTDLQGHPLDFASYEILVLANNCRDQTANVIRAFAKQHPALAVHVAEVQLLPAEAHVGYARRLLMDEACRRLESTVGITGIIASTDADTRVAPTWLAATEMEVRTGADAVGGRIFPERSIRKSCVVRRTHLRDATYRLLRAQLEALVDPDPADLWPRHHQHYGASLAITVAAYRQVGGLPVVPFLEDEALCQALRRYDLRLRHSPAVRVITSARYQGRVAVGLSWQLREWARMTRQQREPLVESGAALVAEWTVRRKLRQLWKQIRQQPRQQAVPSCIRLAALLSVPAGPLTKQLACSSTFGMLWEWVQTHRAVWRRGHLTTLPLALAELRCLIAQEKEASLHAEVLPTSPLTRWPLAPSQQIQPVLRGSVAMQMR